MPRFVLGDVVWAVHQTGKSLVIEDGKKKSERKFVSEEASGKMLDKLVAEKVAAGYVPLDDAGTEVAIVDGQTVVRSVDLERAIRADPYDATAYLVYADWLQGHGDPRGELIVQMVNGVDPLPHLKKHKKALYGSLVNRIVPAWDKAPMIWRFGFIHRVELEREEKYRPISPVLATVLAHPSGALLVEASLGSEDLADIRNSLDMLVRAAPPLRALEIYSGSAIGDLTPVLTAFRELHTLVVKVRARNGHPDSMSPQTLRSLAAHAPPTLRKLALRVGIGPTFSDLEPLFRRTDLTALTHLQLRDTHFDGQLDAALKSAPFAAQLEAIDLEATDIVDHELDDMAKARFRPGWE